MAETQENISKRALLGQRLKAKYPDKEYADDEELFGRINEDYDEYEETIRQKNESEKKLTDIFASQPRNAKFLVDMANGVNPWIAMVEELGMEGITDIFENPEYKKDLAEAHDRYIERLSKGKELEKRYEQELETSLDTMKALQEEKGLSDEQIDQAVDFLMGITNDAIIGKFSRENLEMALKAINHETDVANARAEGEIGGRNAKISEKLRKPAKGDGVPMLGGRNNVERQGGGHSIFDIAADA